MSVTSSMTEIEYPESDGKPMAETDLHRDWMTRLIEMLSTHFAKQRVYVSGNLFIYYEEGNPRKNVAPDVFVVKGVEPDQRRVYKLWEEGTAPCFVLETTSRKTGHQDFGPKMRLYAQLGVHEYFLFDPTREFFKPALLGYRLVGGGYMPLEMDKFGSLISESLGLRIQLEGRSLRLFDATTDEPLLTGAERARSEQLARAQAEQRASAAEAALQQEQLARAALEAELARLRQAPQS